MKERVPHFRPPKRARPGESGRGTDGGTWLRSRCVEGRQALDADGCARDSAGVCRHSMRPPCVSRRRSKVVSRCRASSLAVWPGAILFFSRCFPPTHRNVSLRSQCAHWLWQSVIPSHRTSCFVSDGGLSATSGRKSPKNAAKTKVLGSFRAWNASRVENLLPHERSAQVYRRAFASSLRCHPLAAHAGPRWPGAAGMASAPTAGRINRCHAPVGADAYIGPHTAPLAKNYVIARALRARGNPSSPPHSQF